MHWVFPKTYLGRVVASRFISAGTNETRELYMTFCLPLHGQLKNSSKPNETVKWHTLGRKSLALYSSFNAKNSDKSEKA
jgi:hypothetical protein